MLSIIVPSYNDGNNVINLIGQLKKQKHFNSYEIIIVESGDTTYFNSLKNYSNIRTLNGQKGRARQLKQGYEDSNGSILLFLHADSDISKLNFKKIEYKTHTWGNFTLQFDSEKFYYRLMELNTHLRNKFFNLPYGDTGIFITRDIYEKSGGYSSEMIFEDIDLAKKLNRIKKNEILPDKIITSVRRFEKHGPIWTGFIMGLIFYSYVIGFTNLAKSFYSLIK